MTNSLYSKLALVLLGLFLTTGAVLLGLGYRTNTLYQQEMAQRLNADLAQQLAAGFPLIQNRRPNIDALEHLFHQLMVINPSIEVYLLGPDGRLLSWSSPEHSLRRDYVDLTPIQAFLAGNTHLPLLGDDPRHTERRKVFSVAAIHDGTTLQGYLYVILASEAYQGIADALRTSYALRAGAWGVAASLGLAMLIGLLLFAWLTRRLRLLSKRISLLPTLPDMPSPVGNGDELDRLQQRFDHMAEQIRQQLHTLTTMDRQRRELVASVSHDLRTPLTTLHGYLETLQIKGEQLTPAERTQYLNIALRNSEELAQLVTQLFELARLDAPDTQPHAEPFALAELVQDTLLKHQLSAQQKDVTLTAQTDPGLPFVQADIGLIQRVLDNLLDNALRHTPAGGNITITLGTTQGQVSIAISDTGCGIPSPDLPRIFERFYRPDSSAPDSHHAGLGLAIAKRIIELHGAVISASSTLGLGTTFSFSLPCIDTPP